MLRSSNVGCVSAQLRRGRVAVGEPVCAVVFPRALPSARSAAQCGLFMEHFNKRLSARLLRMDGTDAAASALSAGASTDSQRSGAAGSAGGCGILLTRKVTRERGAELLARAEFTVGEAGSYLIAIELNGAAVSGSPWPLLVHEPADVCSPREPCSSRRWSGACACE